MSKNINEFSKRIEKITELCLQDSRLSTHDMLEIQKNLRELQDVNPPRTQDIETEDMKKYQKKALKKCEHDLYEMTCAKCHKGELLKCGNCDDYQYADDNGNCKVCGNMIEPTPTGWTHVTGYFDDRGGVSLRENYHGWNLGPVDQTHSPPAQRIKFSDIKRDWIVRNNKDGNT